MSHTYIISFSVSLPPKKLSPNAGGHWGQKCGTIKKYREDCMLIAKSTKYKCDEGRWELELDFYLAPDIAKLQGAYVPRDEANAIAGFKAGQDGIADALFPKGDGAKYLKQGAVRLFTRKKDHKGKAFVVVRLKKVVD